MHESDVNNRVCKACYEKNYKLLKQQSAAVVANDASKEIARQGAGTNVYRGLYGIVPALFRD